MENNGKTERIEKAKAYLKTHSIEFDSNATMTQLEQAVDKHKITLRKQNRANNKETKVKATLITYDTLNKANLTESLYNSKGTPENPLKVSAKFNKTIVDFENELKGDLKYIFDVHKENWLGTKINQPTMSVTFYKEEFNINLEKPEPQELRVEDEYEDEEIY